MPATSAKSTRSPKPAPTATAAAPFVGFSPVAFAFPRELTATQSRAWFEANRAIYERELHQPLASLDRVALLRMKSWVVRRPVTQKTAGDADVLIGAIAAFASTAKPLLRFGWAALA